MPFLARIAVIGVAIASIIWAPVARSSDDVPPNIRIVELRQTEVALRETYPKKKKMGLPRMVLLDANGHVLYGGMGLPNDLGARLHKALHNAKPLDTAITLDAILAETERADGSHIALADLPKADAYVVDYWASWCAPCRMMSRDLKVIMSRTSDMQFVWLQIESDPDKLPDER